MSRSQVGTNKSQVKFEFETSMFCLRRQCPAAKTSVCNKQLSLSLTLRRRSDFPPSKCVYSLCMCLQAISNKKIEFLKSLNKGFFFLLLCLFTVRLQYLICRKRFWHSVVSCGLSHQCQLLFICNIIDLCLWPMLYVCCVLTWGFHSAHQPGFPVWSTSKQIQTGL